MAKQRMIGPELFKLKALFAAEQQYRLPLRLAFLGLLRCCDCSGRFNWHPIQLKQKILPYDEINFSMVLEALETQGFISKHKIAGKVCGFIPDWRNRISS